MYATPFRTKNHPKLRWKAIPFASLRSSCSALFTPSGQNSKSCQLPIPIAYGSWRSDQ